MAADLTLDKNLFLQPFSQGFHTYLCMHVNIYIYISMYACKHIYMYMCICIYICIYTSPYAFFAESMNAFTGVVEHHACAGVYIRQML